MPGEDYRGASVAADAKEPWLTRDAGQDLAAGAADSVERTLTEALLAERERASFQAESTQVLSGLLNPERTVSRALHLVVPRLADWAQVVVLVQGGVVATSSGGLVARTPDRALVDPHHRRGLAHVLRTGRPDQLAVVDPAELEPLVPAPSLRAELAGALPLTALALPLRAGGAPIGALILVRRGAGSFDHGAAAMATNLAPAVATALEAARLYAGRSHTARVLEESLRPSELPEIPGVRLASYYRSNSPDHEVGGDFYDVHGGDGDWSLIVGDVSGSGIEAAVATGRARQSLRTAGLIDRNPGSMLDLANRSLLGNGSGRFVTILCARLRPTPGGVRLDLASAGHPPPLLLRADGAIEEPAVTGPAAGLFPGGDHPVTAVDLAPGDRCLMYTDGVTEARGPDRSFFGSRLVDAVAACAGADPAAMVGYVAQQVLEHLAGGPHDDVALLAIGVDP